MKRLLILLAVLAATAFFSAPAMAGGCYGGYGGYRSYYRPVYSYRSYYRPYHSHYRYGSIYRPYGGVHYHHFHY